MWWVILISGSGEPPGVTEEGGREVWDSVAPGLHTTSGKYVKHLFCTLAGHLHSPALKHCPQLEMLSERTKQSYFWVDSSKQDHLIVKSQIHINKNSFYFMDLNVIFLCESWDRINVKDDCGSYVQFSEKISDWNKKQTNLKFKLIYWFSFWIFPTFLSNV